MRACLIDYIHWPRQIRTIWWPFFTTFILYSHIRIGRLTVFFNYDMFDINPGKSPIVIHYGIASSSYLHLRASCCTCDFLCSNHSFWKHKGKFHILSLWLIWFYCHVEFYFFQFHFHAFLSDVQYMSFTIQIHQWKSWEDYAKNMEYDPEGGSDC